MKAKFIKESLKEGWKPWTGYQSEQKPNFPSKLRNRHQKIKLPKGMQEEFGIPDFALMYDGINAPEAAVYVDERLEVGDVTSTYEGDPVVVIYKDENGVLATKAINKEGLDESVYTSGEITDNEYLDELYATKDALLSAMEDAQELSYSSENIRMIGEELADVEHRIEAEELEMAEVREM